MPALLKLILNIIIILIKNEIYKINFAFFGYLLITNNKIKYKFILIFNINIYTYSTITKITIFQSLFLFSIIVFFILFISSLSISNK